MWCVRTLVDIMPFKDNTDLFVRFGFGRKQEVACANQDICSKFIYYVHYIGSKSANDTFVHIQTSQCYRCQKRNLLPESTVQRDPSSNVKTLLLKKYDIECSCNPIFRQPFVCMNEFLKSIQSFSSYFLICCSSLPSRQTPMTLNSERDAVQQHPFVF